MPVIYAVVEQYPDNDRYGDGEWHGRNSKASTIPHEVFTYDYFLEYGGWDWLLVLHG